VKHQKKIFLQDNETQKLRGKKVAGFPQDLLQMHTLPGVSGSGIGWSLPSCLYAADAILKFFRFCKEKTNMINEGGKVDSPRCLSSR
jgi:hypothetical protein